MTLARELGMQAVPDLEQHLEELRRVASGIQLIGEVSDRLRARVMAAGELMATRLGAAYLGTQGLDVEWLDARSLLRAEERPHTNERVNFLSATCNFEPDPELQRRLSRDGVVYLTQGFIASDAQGETVLLGRGGSDTSGSYLAAKLGARRLEIWTDVPGMFTANPHAVTGARLLRSLDYDEAQEIASSGAKVLHPRCILPAKQYAIPLTIHATQFPEHDGTEITATGGDGGARVKAVCVKKGITLVAMETLGMWHQVGFLADAFSVFRDHGLSIDLVSTSETSVTVTLDPAVNALEPRAVQRLVKDLSRICRVEVIGPCAAVSLVGRNIRAVMHRLGDALELFEEQKIYLVTQAANDLNLTFVVDEEQGDRLVRRLHELTVRHVPADRVLGPTWEQIHGQGAATAPGPAPWWHARRAELIEIATRAGQRLCLRARGAGEQRRRAQVARGHRPASVRDQGQSAPRDPGGLRRPGPGVRVRVARRGRAGARGRARHRSEADSLHARTSHPARSTPGRSRLAPGSRSTTCTRCVTGASCSAVASCWFASTRATAADTTTTCAPQVCTRSSVCRCSSSRNSSAGSRHSGRASSGSMRTPAAACSTSATGRKWGNCSAVLPRASLSARVLNLGGGLGVPEKPGQAPVDLAALQGVIDELRGRWPRLKLWLEPGRFLVAQAGVLVAQVTQLKGKGAVQYVGVATGMNSLIRPALYGAHHDIVNLSRLGEPGTEVYNVVGPICESADHFGHERLLPPTEEGDVLLIANAGAYGRVMGSWYNLREPAVEVLV